ncbi:MAG: hypothetical protein ACOCQR_01225 [bacterium]
MRYLRLADLVIEEKLEQYQQQCNKDKLIFLFENLFKHNVFNN